MIQRIQSIYLSMTFLLSLLFLKGSFLNFSEGSGSVLKVTFNGLIRDISLQNHELIEKMIPISVIIILIPAIALLTIFLFKKREIQLMLVRLLIIVCSVFILLCGYYSYSLIVKFDAEIIFVYKMLLPVLILVLSVLAQRGIKKDDQLVKSYNRLR
jgi:hypothetical protein